MKTMTTWVTIDEVNGGWRVEQDSCWQGYRVTLEEALALAKEILEGKTTLVPLGEEI